MWIFTKAILKGRPIQVFNHGRMSRDFTYIDDIIVGVKGALFAKDLSKQEIFNLGNHRAEKLLDMISVLADALGRRPVLEMAELQPGDVPATFADIEKARSKLGFEPVTAIREGIPRFVDWYCDYHQVDRRKGGTLFHEVHEVQFKG